MSSDGISGDTAKDSVQMYVSLSQVLVGWGVDMFLISAASPSATPASVRDTL